MGTPNFAYNNRCVVVTDEDYDCGYHPQLSDECNINLHGRSFPSYKLPFASNGLRFFVIVLTAGYYEDACIDYETIENFDPDNYPYEDVKRQTFSEFQYLAADYKQTKGGLYEYLAQFEISRNKFNKIVAHKNLEEACYAVMDYLKDEEEKKVNKIIDEIRDDYGYEEIACKGVFSNGEAVYERVV